MYYSYVEFEYVSTKKYEFSPARTDLTVKLLTPNIQWKHGFNSCDKGLTQEMVTTTAAVTSTMQNVEYVKYNTTTDQTHLKQTTCVVGVRVNQKKGYHHSNKYYLKAYGAGSVKLWS